jgi:regulator of PEP synthase PpsR (kinase-PPPase family)
MPIFRHLEVKLVPAAELKQLGCETGAQHTLTAEYFKRIDALNYRARAPSSSA